MKKKVREIIESHLKGRDYHEDLLPQWINDILENILEELHASKKPIKYCATCTIMQRTGAAIHSAKAAYWDIASDGKIRQNK